MNRKEKALEFGTDYTIQITGRHVDITDSIKSYTVEKLAKLEKFSDRIIDINVILTVQKLDHQAEIIAKFGNFKVTSTASSEDMYSSIDKAVAKLEAQIRRYKSKIQDHHAKKLSFVDMNVNVLQRLDENDLELDLEEEEGASHQPIRHEIINKEVRPLKTLTADEALMKMELSGDAFLVYKSEEDQKIKILYKRKDENFGLIEPKY